MGFMKYFSPNVDWTVISQAPSVLSQTDVLRTSETHPCADRYTTLASSSECTNKRLGVIMKEPGVQQLVRNIIAGGGWVVSSWGLRLNARMA